MPPRSRLCWCARRKSRFLADQTWRALSRAIRPTRTTSTHGTPVDRLSHSEERSNTNTMAVRLPICQNDAMYVRGTSAHHCRPVAHGSRAAISSLPVVFRADEDRRSNSGELSFVDDAELVTYMGHQEETNTGRGGRRAGQKRMKSVKIVSGKNGNHRIAASSNNVSLRWHLEELHVRSSRKSSLQLEQEIRKNRVTKAALARMLRTSHTQINRLLDPACDVTVSSLQRAAALVGRRIRLELVEPMTPDWIRKSLRHFPREGCQ